MEPLPEVTDPRIIDGRKIAQDIEAKVKNEVEVFVKEHGTKPALATILVGEHPPSKLYVKLKHWAAKRVGIISEDHKFPHETEQEEIIGLIDTLNRRPEIHGILVQLPLPKHIDERIVMMKIAPIKDVDGFNPLNMGKMLIGSEGFVPCTPKGIIRALSEHNIDPKGMEVVVVGHSNVVGKPAAIMLLNRNATVKICHVFSKDLKSQTQKADILIVATGVRGLVKADMVKEGAIVFDVGITWQDEKVYGDVDFEDVLPKVKLISPVPGGVGPMTIAILMEHTLEAAKIQSE
ncbi:MAG: 5,10-methylenetetrahydrofolate dehydrogenase (NADP+) / methenyltetrahydrofolate cyclohydrolase [Candidatus Methanoperedens nitroreducens]|uniref:Bifunctional protein FolD n=1 Tax=Candidatus Methanoperedens nitratireducens TaxID=1392998 RepID=A0A0P7ZDJ7_9EURY|nr:tetrahydrofolate dehydrogenase/cyclohydrolase catalytic domain-containing protein [Candidatus Methanoperedens sp. BLZ2]KAB2945955.1 MAG: bifunctional methylenetetrahydrofolate dehydrogenase/methenyltetrahydrofolate cyclohydrolase [Candidatus Methanoperedens sp.]KPQ42764.1 MAG: 5,10-methylenetetrahydrofolate dehydrogenase (NADP+) / methenyltetrahydrofolate cyclohydrolase [Candidatus Methanoperedens sp. BLZ1]MBZ0177509.1 bifunctional methylenetetrahydrofolate dehydrogenase/methenyltetrahydrofol